MFESEAKAKEDKEGETPQAPSVMLDSRCGVVYQSLLGFARFDPRLFA